MQISKSGRDDLIRLRKRPSLNSNSTETDDTLSRMLDAITKALKSIASKRGTPIGKVIELGPREATEPAQQTRKESRELYEVESLLNF
jgi:hypothetical protein